ncbi:MAG: hypothetical protein M3389_05930, partial [Actinomycetota bacterium]|nr:hypothetical protein [Actinomycetota bacterium]
MAGDHLALVADADLRRADRRRDPQPGERDRDRVAVLANGHQRLAVDADRSDLGAVERSGLRQRAQQPAFVGELVGDRRRAALEAPGEVLLAGVAQHEVQLRDRRDRRNGNEVVASKAADLAFDAALLVCALKADRRKQGAEEVVRAHRDEAVRLDPAAALEDLLDGRAEVVVADLLEDPAKPVKRLGVTLEKRLLRLDRRGHAERRAREARAHEEQMHRRPGSGDVDVGLPPVDLGGDRGRVDLRHEHVPGHVTELAAALAHVIADRRLGDLGAVLVDEAPPNALRRVALLARRVDVGEQPRIDQLAIRTELRRRPRHRHATSRRQRRRKRRPDGAAMHPMALGERAQRQVLTLAITTDLLELF